MGDKKIEKIQDWVYEGVSYYDGQIESQEKKIEILKDKINEIIDVINSLAIPPSKEG